MNIFKKIPLFLRVWFFAGFLSLIFAGLAYVLVQQSYRMSANDPQIQIMIDATEALDQGVTPDQLIPSSTPVNLATTLDAFLIVLDDKGQVIASSAQLNGKTPVPSSGVFDSVKNKGQDRFTWQPEKGVRIAAVVDKYQTADSSGFLLVGRSLKEIEKREMATLILSAGAWVASLIVSMVLAILFFFHRKPRHVIPEIPKETEGSKDIEIKE